MEEDGGAEHHRSVSVAYLESEVGRAGMKYRVSSDRSLGSLDLPAVSRLYFVRVDFYCHSLF